MINKLIIALSLPALFIHELSHIIMITLLGVKGQGIDIIGDFTNFEVVVHYETKSNFKKNLISLAPILGFIVWFILISLTSGPSFLILITYSLTFIRVFSPSKHDIDTFEQPIIEEIEIPFYVK